MESQLFRQFEVEIPDPSGFCREFTRFGAPRHIVRSNATVATPRSGPAAHQFSRALQVGKVIDLGPGQVRHSYRLGPQRSLGD